MCSDVLAESSLLELLDVAKSNRENKTVHTPKGNPPVSERSENPGNSSQFNQLPQTSPASVRPVLSSQQPQQPQGRHQFFIGSAGPAGGRSEYRPHGPQNYPNPSTYSSPYGQQGVYHPPNLSSAPQGYPRQYEQRIQMGSRVDTKGGMSQQYGRQFPSGQDQAKKPRVEHSMRTTEGPMRSGVSGSEQQRVNMSEMYRQSGGNEEMERAFGSQTGGSFHLSASDVASERGQWTDVMRRPGNLQHRRYSNPAGRSNDWRRSWQDSGSSGKLLLIIRGLPGSGKTTLAKFVD